MHSNILPIAHKVKNLYSIHGNCIWNKYIKFSCHSRVGGNLFVQYYDILFHKMTSFMRWIPAFAGMTSLKMQLPCKF